MKIKVIHSSYGHFTVRTLVATVTVEKITDHHQALEVAYTKTQNVFDSWSMPEEIGPEYDTHQDGGKEVEVEAPLHDFGGKPCGLRSSMMGDRFQVIDPDNYDPDLFYVCAMVGFDPCDPVDYRVMGKESSYIVRALSDHLLRDHPEYKPYKGLDYQEV